MPCVILCKFCFVIFVFNFILRLKGHSFSIDVIIRCNTAGLDVIIMRTAETFYLSVGHLRNCLSVFLSQPGLGLGEFCD